ncbi:MAG TPA: glycosyltransferase [Candidatus Angelobacter sp.]
MSALGQTSLAPAESQASVSLGALAVSVIIPALNEAKVIGRCLESITHLDFPRHRFEVIVVDNGSTDATIAIAESFRDQITLRTLRKTGVHISALRNLGAREARGAILAFLDADCLAPRGWLADMTGLMSTAGPGVVGAHYLLPDHSSWVGRTWHRYQEAPKSGDVSHVPAGDLIMRREDYLRVGGFDETIQTNEDYELCQRARAAGMPVRAVPRVGVVHLGTAQSLRAFYCKQRWHGTHVMKVFLRDVFGSHNHKAVAFAWVTLLAATLIAGGTIWSFFDGPQLLPLAGLIALFAPPLSLSLRQVARRGKWSDFLPLTALYLTYGVARAAALLNLKNLF